MILDDIFIKENYSINCFHYKSENDLNNILSLIDIYYPDCIICVDKKFKNEKYNFKIIEYEKQLIELTKTNKVAYIGNRIRLTYYNDISLLILIMNINFPTNSLQLQHRSSLIISFYNNYLNILKIRWYNTKIIDNLKKEIRNKKLENF